MIKNLHCDTLSLAVEYLISLKSENGVICIFTLFTNLQLKFIVTAYWDETVKNFNNSNHNNALDYNEDDKGEKVSRTSSSSLCRLSWCRNRKFSCLNNLLFSHSLTHSLRLRKWDNSEQCDMVDAAAYRICHVDGLKKQFELCMKVKKLMIRKIARENKFRRSWDIII